MTIELEFICELCGRPVDDGQGCLYVPFAEIRRHHEEQQNWWERQGDTWYRVVPAYALWRVTHTACRSVHADIFEIAVEQVRTWRDLAQWTSHLLAKEWLVATDWGHLLGAAVEGRDHRLVPAEVRGDAA
jgi:hypothetical protein